MNRRDLERLELDAQRQRRGVTKRTRAKPGPKPDPNRRPKRQDTAWQKIQAEQLSLEPYCRLCAREGKQVPAAEVDHIIPLADGGSFDGPLQSLCLWHHAQKTENENAARQGRKPRRIQLRAPVDPETGLPLPGYGHWWRDERSESPRPRPIVMAIKIGHRLRKCSGKE